MGDRSEAAQRGAGGRPPKHSTGAPPDRPTGRKNEQQNTSLPLFSLPPSALSPPAHRISGCIAPIFAHAHSLNRRSPIGFGRSSLSLYASSYVATSIVEVI